MSEQPTPPNDATGEVAAVERDLADTFYGSEETLVSSYGPRLADSLDRLGDLTGMTPAERDASLRAAVAAFHDASIGPEPASRLHALIVQHVKAPPDDATVESWGIDARRQLRERFGLAEGQRRLAIAEQFVAKRPELAKLLRESGVGSHPDVIMALAENAAALRITPRASKKA